MTNLKSRVNLYDTVFRKQGYTKAQPEGVGVRVKSRLVDLFGRHSVIHTGYDLYS